jgi:hypothetical protein
MEVFVMNHHAEAYLRAGRMAVDPGYVLLLRPFGDRMVAEHDRAHVMAVEHAFTINERGGVRGNLDLLAAINEAMPHLRFCDFWHGYLKYLAAEVMLDRQVDAAR